MFQSTPPARAATDSLGDSAVRRGVSIHAAREGGDECMETLYRLGSVSIHAAREGGDAVEVRYVPALAVSIHAAREGGDTPAPSLRMVHTCFNPRRPRGRRLELLCPLLATSRGSIHAAREGGDLRCFAQQLHFCEFQSTPPARAATGNRHRGARHLFVSIHAAREGGDATR